MNSSIITEESAIVTIDGEVIVVKKNDDGLIFDKAVKAIQAGNYNLIPSILSPKKLIDKLGLKFNEDTGSVFYGDIELRNNLTDRIFKYWEEDIPYKPLLRLLKKIMKHEVEYMKEEPFNFIEKNNMAITEDGCFLAFKLANEDGSPYYHSSSDVRYEAGKTLKMSKKKASSNREVCGGAGFYFGNRNYWGSHFFNQDNTWNGSGEMFLAKINPIHVTAIPRRYEDGKGKCYKMKIIKSFTPEVAKEVLTNSVIKGEYYCIRDKRGRFTRLARDDKGRFKSRK